VDLYYFSYTGTSKSIALALARELKIVPKEIKSYSFPYPIWLLFSFIPHFSLKAYFEPQENSYGILIFPKWTFNCPPVTYFLKHTAFEKLFMIITYGGWREKPYGEYYKNLATKRCKDVDLIFIKKSEWEKNKYSLLIKIEEKIKNFINRYNNFQP